MMRAFVCDESVTIPACEPVSEIARWPRSLIAIAHRAHEIRSPVESSMSISRGSGRSEISRAISTSSSVVLPRAESTATTLLPASRAATISRAARLISSGPATEVPPNFITTIWVDPAFSGACITGSAMEGEHRLARVRRRLRSLKPEVLLAAILVLAAAGAVISVLVQRSSDDEPDAAPPALRPRAPRPPRPWAP